MVCIMNFDVFALIGFLNHSRYSSKVIKPANDLAIMNEVFDWLKLVLYGYKHKINFTRRG